MICYYIAGPLSPISNDFKGALEYINNCRNFFLAEAFLIRRGYNCYNPARDIISLIVDNFPESEIDDLISDIYVRGLDWIRRCDRLITLPGWENSRGARQEVFIAYCEGKQLESIRFFAGKPAITVPLNIDSAGELNECKSTDRNIIEIPNGDIATRPEGEDVGGVVRPGEQPEEIFTTTNPVRTDRLEWDSNFGLRYVEDDRPRCKYRGTTTPGDGLRIIPSKPSVSQLQEIPYTLDGKGAGIRREETRPENERERNR